MGSGSSSGNRGGGGGGGAGGGEEESGDEEERDKKDERPKMPVVKDTYTQHSIYSCAHTHTLIVRFCPYICAQMLPVLVGAYINGSVLSMYQ